MASIHEVKVYKWHLTKNMEMGWDTFLNKNRGDIYRLGIEVKLQFWNFCRSRLMKTLGFMVKHLSPSSNVGPITKMITFSSRIRELPPKVYMKQIRGKTDCTCFRCCKNLKGIFGPFTMGEKGVILVLECYSVRML